MQTRKRRFRVYNPVKIIPVYARVDWKTGVLTELFTLGLVESINTYFYLNQ